MHKTSTEEELTNRNVLVMYNLVPRAFSSTIFKMADHIEKLEDPGDEVGLCNPCIVYESKTKDCARSWTF